MKASLVTLTFLSLAALAASAPSQDRPEERAHAQDREAAGRGGGDAPSMPVARPGEEHRILRRMVGDWNAETRVFMGGPEPMISRGLETNRLVANDLWLEQKYEGAFFGRPFEGHGFVGYDAEKGEYVGTWLDSMSTRISLLEKGVADHEARTLTFEVAGRDPMTGQPTRERHTHHFGEDGQRTFTMEMLPPEGDPRKLMEVVYTRRTDREGAAGEPGRERGGAQRERR